MDITVKQDVDILVRCEKCGGELSASKGMLHGRREDFAIDVEPCDICADNVRDEGYKDGYNDGEAGR